MQSTKHSTWEKQYMYHKLCNYRIAAKLYKCTYRQVSFQVRNCKHPAWRWQQQIIVIIVIVIIIIIIIIIIWNENFSFF
jgi:hypothetical protein